MHVPRGPWVVEASSLDVPCFGLCQVVVGTGAGDRGDSYGRGIHQRRCRGRVDHSRGIQWWRSSGRSLAEEMSKKGAHGEGEEGHEDGEPRANIWVSV